MNRNENKNDCFLLALLLIVFAGCNNAPPNEDKPQPFSFSESVQSTSESEAPAGKESKEVYCWDNPIRAGAHCKYLERDIHSRLDRYKADEEITAVWIWAEEVSDGIYDIYIGYA